MKQIKKTEMIVCPYCKAEYLPAEIFVPKAFIGTTKTVVRDEKGKLVDHDNNSMYLNETYICDYCNKKFEITANVEFVSNTNPTDDLSEDFTTTIKKEQFQLTE